ncbi:interleukin 17a/f3 [Pangasianodon hypophthalmus]|uniref:interleukin 17a/f3 n=1 Tax=Pangasianodon hypophthalmus TaxID=310915 RepID=UPI000F00A147|nr:interleukin 17a/f3 [Pangasianodon hypophthalmus]
MHISVLFKVILLLAMGVLLLGADHSPAGRRGKKERKRDPANRGSKRKARKLWLSFDSAVESQPDTYQISPSQSISPWTYEVSYDESRIPSRIFEAKCERTGCLNKDGSEDIGLESKPIFYQILVLRRVKGKKKNYSFRLEKHTTSVGCTCVSPNVISHM